MHELKTHLRKARQGADWDTLSVCGAPLLLRKKKQYVNKPLSQELLTQELRAACTELTLCVDDPAYSRKNEALQSLLLALQIHFPTFFKKHFGNSAMILEILNRPITGKIIKLKRQAAAILSTYL